MTPNKTRKTVGVAAVLVAILGVLPVSLHAQSQQQTRGSENFGLRGPVHTVIQASKELNPGPRTERRLSAYDTSGWLEFDSHGSFLAQGNDLSKMSEAPRNVYVYDSQGRFLEMGMWAADGSTLIRQVYKYGPFGPVEASWYAGEQLTGRTAIEYDEHGNFTGDKSYDSEGRLTHESMEKYDSRNAVLEMEGMDAEGHPEVHVTDSANEKSAILEHNSLDEKAAS